VTHFAPGGCAWQSSWPITASRPTGKGPAASAWPRSVRPWPGSSVRAICLGTWQPPHRTGGPSDRRRSGARRELAVPCPSPHAAACVWILSGEHGSRYACPAIVSGPPKFPTYGSLYRVNPTAVPGLLERLTDERGGHGRSRKDVPHKHLTGTAVASLSMPLRNTGPWATSAHASPTPCPRRKPAPLSLKLDITIKMPGQRRLVFRILPQCPFTQIRQNRYTVLNSKTLP
jgi:hypothetical protein